MCGWVSHGKIGGQNNMIKLWLTFALFAVAIHFGITAVRNMSGRDRWTLTKKHQL